MQKNIKIKIQELKSKNGFMSMLTFAIVGVLFAALLITSVFIYRSRVEPSESIFRDMVFAMEDVRSFQYSGEFRIETEGGSDDVDNAPSPESSLMSEFLLGEFVIAGGFEGAADLSNEEDPRHSIGIDMSLVSQTEGTRVEFFVDGDIRANKNNLYLRLSELPDVIPFFSLSGLKDQWIEFEFADMERKNIMTEREALVEALEKHPPFIMERAASERVNGVRTTKYALDLDRDNLAQFNREFRELIDEPITEEESLEFLASLQLIEEFEGHIWVGNSDNLLHRLSFTVLTRNDSGSLTSTYVNVTLSDFNSPQSIDIPENSRTLEEIMQEAFGGLLPDGLLPEGSDTPNGMDFDTMGESDILFDL